MVRSRPPHRLHRMVLRSLDCLTMRWTGDPSAPPCSNLHRHRRVLMPPRSRRARRPVEEGRVMRPTEQMPVVTEIEVVADAVVPDVVQPDPTTAELAVLTEEGWQLPDRLFWETVDKIGPPKLRHRIDMVMTRGSGADMKTRVITMYDGVTD